MHVLLLHDLILSYVMGRIDAAGRQIIRRILLNDGTKFLVSQKFIDDLTVLIDAEHRTDLQSLITLLLDRSVMVAPANGHVGTEEEMGRLAESVPDECVPVLSFNAPTASQARFIPNVGVIAQCEKPNYHWLVSQLVIDHPSKVSVDSADFGSETDIIRYFHDIFYLSRNAGRILIFDRETANFDHGKLDTIRNTPVDYYTFQHHNYYLDQPSIIAFFRKLRIFTTRDKALAHSRKIVFSNLTVISDNALNNIKVGGDWSVDVQISAEQARRWRSICSKYKRAYP